MKRLITSLFIGLISFVAVIGLSGQALAFDPFKNPDDTGSQTCTATNDNGQTSPVCATNGQDPISGKDQEGILLKVAKLLNLVVGVAAVIIIIIGGLQYVLSSGDPSRINSAKNTILFAVIGLIVAVFAQAIIRFVLVKL